MRIFLAVSKIPMFLSSSRRQQGFTLIELLLVLAIMAITTATLMPQMFSQGGRGDYVRLTPSLQQALDAYRQQALHEGRSMEFVVDEVFAPLMQDWHVHMPSESTAITWIIYADASVYGAPITYTHKQNRRLQLAIHVQALTGQLGVQWQ
ncbi:prepilin-type N-terminal cleavage/methylation domain-containing protein [Allopseudospirillum japonicum]|uniref:Prepilin-type N-terminal cleavage/methylation domain-containing protein n=1 Tax=Allopseudospirillum japonicum TaxID=64971 RepID=A0A1H6R2F4_9GAMM|nr:type II secretion system protein [Allopseudospirillum japonicum]SEI46677.1 prepilin-type N-terminal cleavage/methylation domain-containing protein [Allopseudospirillum japonicum]